MEKIELDEQRVARERETYNQGLERKGYNKVLEHANLGPGHEREIGDISEMMRQIDGKRVLEIGSVPGQIGSTLIKFNHKN